MITKYVNNTTSLIFFDLFHFHPSQFILTLRQNGRTVYQQILSPKSAKPSNVSGLRGWSWGFPAESAHYIGLYPRAWTVYELPQYQLLLVCQQISPVIPNDYQTSCLPVCIFLWQVLNLGAQPIEVCITFSWHGPDAVPRNTPGVTKNSTTSVGSNGVSCMSRSLSTDTPDALAAKSPDHYFARSASFYFSDHSLSGCFLERIIGNELPCCFGIAAKQSDRVTVSRCPGFMFSKTTGLTTADSGETNSMATVYGSAAEGDQDAEWTAYHSYRVAPSAQTFWSSLRSNSGLEDLDGVGYYVPNTASSRKQLPKLGIAVSATCFAPPAQRQNHSVVPGRSEIEFAIVWHSPIVRFRSGEVIYTRRYARWFPEPGMLGTKRLLLHVTSEWRQWVNRIENWQNSILNKSSLPDWYKSALFNELYFLTDGGTVWLDPIVVEGIEPEGKNSLPIDAARAYRKDCFLDPNGLTGRRFADQKSDCEKIDEVIHMAWKHRCEIGREMGLFGYLEGHEYRMYNTIDVHFYASWALIKLWPKLQLAINYDCADLTVAEDCATTYFIHQGQSGLRSAKCSVPHDFGDPEHDPWRHPNAYIMFQTDNWKDLNTKFILQAWRDWKLTQDYQYSLYMIPIVCRLVRLCVKAWDSDRDGVIENSGFPDQTYDTWTTHGMSAYTGGLWLACVYAAYDMVHSALSDSSPVKSYFSSSADDRNVSWSKVAEELHALLTRAKFSYEAALWTGTYYAYQSTRAGNHDSIMADQLCGHWFLRVSGAPADAILPRKHVIETLKTIKASNCSWIHNGTFGAINGTLPGCKQDLSCCQAEEFWVGVNYALASTMIAEDMAEEGFPIAGAAYNTVYNRFGLQYQTPEAYMVDGRFRCTGYMRPLAIWSLQQAIELKDREKQPNPQNGFH
ncbi:Bile acid beta glucosidase [Fasciola gigantica]|uniref:Bile acid beta glucosidase n=1 Tax=Fasciola gigantica TaxID=46835 RepID=A0A504YYF9_FASGI|nr:Bile acid beta glucosidase [Fasciola gigantica]